MTTAGWRRAAWLVLLFMSLTGLLVTIAHYAFQPTVEEAIAGRYGPSPAWFLEQVPRYREHAVMTFLHVVPGFLFMLLAPLQLIPRLRSLYPVVHRSIGWVFITLSLPIVTSGVALAVIMPFDGLLETYGTLLIAAGYLASLVLGVRAIRRRDTSRHRIWMSRMLAIGYAPITMRFLLPPLTEGFGLDGQSIFAETLLIALVINLLVVRWWLRRHPRSAAASPAPSVPSPQHIAASTNPTSG